jgi:hypothetical protein
MTLRSIARSLLAVMTFTGLARPIFGADLTLSQGGRVSIELLASESGSSTTLLLDSPAASLAAPVGCAVGPVGTLTGLPLLNEELPQRGCRVLLDAAAAAGVQPFGAGTPLRFQICVQTDDDADCESVFSSNPTLNADGLDHLRTTPILATEFPGRIFQLAWEDEPGGGDNDFNDLVAVLRVDADSDGDGLWDDWERFGIDADGNGSIDLDLPALGADPLRKDIFLEIDYMACGPVVGSDCVTFPGGHSHRPKDAALALVVGAFADAPVSNPDGSTGIDLHVDVSSALPHQNYLILNEDTCGDPAGFGIGSLDSVKADPAYFGSDNPRRFAFHYQIWGHRKVPGGRGMSSGCAELPGNDSLVTLGDWNTLCVGPGGNGTLDTTLAGDDVIVSWPDPDGTGPRPIPRSIFAGPNLTCDSVPVHANDVGFTPRRDIDADGLDDRTVGTLLQQAGTLMHELGHNLELRHGGDDPVNNKPNYLSVMNYLFQVDGIPPRSAFVAPRIDYSDADLPSLTELVLDERVGIQDGAFDRTFFFCPSGAFSSGAGSGPVDWNCDGDGGQDASTTVDINGVDTINLIPLSGFDDWAALRLDMQSAPDFADGSSESSQDLDESQDQVQLEIPQLVEIDITPEELPNRINPRAKGTLPVAILSGPGFSAPQHVASDTLRFGRTGEEASLAFCNLPGEDVDGDGLLDLVCHFTRRLTDFREDSVEGKLRAQTIWGKSLLGSAPVEVLSR